MSIMKAQAVCVLVSQASGAKSGTLHLDTAGLPPALESKHCFRALCVSDLSLSHA